MGDDDGDAADDDENDASKRRDELDALRAIYADDIVACARALTVTLFDGAWRCEVELPRSYPSTSAPKGDALALKSRTTRAMEIERWASEAMLDAWEAARGEVCVFDWLERVRREIEDAEGDEDEGSDANADDSTTSLEDELAAIAAENARRARGDDSGDGDAIIADVRRRLTSHEPIVEKKSIFQAHVCRNAASMDDVDATLKILAESRKFREATHNILAYRIEHGSTFWQDFDDDGETAAGGRLLRVLQLSDARNVVVVVSRWYGGVKLGPKRFQVINTVALDALAATA